MGILKLTPKNLALIEGASADTFAMPVDNDPVKMMSGIMMWLITLIELDPRVFKLIKSDVALFLAAYKKIVGPEVVDKILKFITTYRNGGTEITMLGSSRMMGGVTSQQLDAAKAKAEAEGHTPADVIFYNKTREQFERERQLVVTQTQLQELNTQQQQDQLTLQPITQSALQTQMPDVNTVQSQFTNAYDVFAAAFADLQSYRDKLSEREKAIEEQFQKLQPELNISQAKLLELHASSDDVARIESAKKNIKTLQESIRTIDEKISATSVTEARPLAAAAALSIGGTVAVVSGATAVLTVAGVGLAAAALTGATVTGLAATAAVAVAEGVAQTVEENPGPVMQLMKNIGSGFVQAFRHVGDTHEDRWDQIEQAQREAREKELAQGVASGLMTPSGQPRTPERLASFGIIPRVGNSTDITKGPNLYSPVPPNEFSYDVKLGFLDGQEFCYNPIGEEAASLEEDDPSQPWSISFKKVIADKITRYVVLASVTGAVVGTYYIANRFYRERKSALMSQKEDYQKNIDRAITEVETILNAARTQRQQALALVESKRRDLSREQENISGQISALHKEFTDAEDRRLATFKQLSREYTQAVAAAHAAAENRRMNQQNQQIQLMMLASMAQPGLLQNQALQMLHNSIPQTQLLGNANGTLPSVSSQVEEQLDEGGGLNHGRLPSLPTRRGQRSSSSSKKRYTHRRQALRTGKGGYRPTKTGRKA
jgi:hypothetical protein